MYCVYIILILSLILFYVIHSYYILYFIIYYIYTTLDIIFYHPFYLMLCNIRVWCISYTSSGFILHLSIFTGPFQPCFSCCPFYIVLLLVLMPVLSISYFYHILLIHCSYIYHVLVIHLSYINITDITLLYDEHQWAPSVQKSKHPYNTVPLTSELAVGLRLVVIIE